MGYSTRKVDDWINTYLEYTDNTEPPQLYRIWCAVSAIAAALRRKCALRWGLGMDVYPNMYIVLVGPPAARKGTAMHPVESIIRTAGIPLAASAVTKEALSRALLEAETIESTEDKPILHSSLTILSKELTVLVGQANIGLLSHLTDWYDCAEKWKYQTKNAGTDDLQNIWVNIIGATTPDLIRTSFPIDAVGSGFTSRVIFVYEEKKGRVVAFPAMSERERQLGGILQYDYDLIASLRGDFVVTQDFRELWETYYTNAENMRFFPEAYNRFFGGYIERRGIHLLKLSMILNASRTNSMQINALDLNRALKLLEWTEQKMYKTFAGLGRGKDASVYEGMCVLLSRENELSFAQLCAPFRGDLDYNTLKATANSLVSMGVATMTLKGTYKWKDS